MIDAYNRFRDAAEAVAKLPQSEGVTPEQLSAQAARFRAIMRLRDAARAELLEVNPDEAWPTRSRP